MSQQKAILDSGAFSAWKISAGIDMDEYVEFVRRYGQLFAGGAITLDVIGDGAGSYRNWLYMRRAGVDVFPVYHLRTDEKWLEKYLKQTDHIGLGLGPISKSAAQVDARMLALDHLWKKYLLDVDGKPKARVHGLGVTSPEIVARYPWCSVDSSIVVQAAAFGGVVVPKLTFTRSECRRNYDPNVVFRLYVTTQSMQSGRPTFHSLSPIVKAAYTDYFAEYGWVVGGTTEMEQPLLRSEKRKLMKLEKKGVTVHKYPAFPLTSEMKSTLVDSIPENTPLTIAGTLASSWKARRGANFDFWAEFQRQFPSPTIYHVVGSYADLDLATIQRGLPFLISYYYLRKSETLLKEILALLGGENA